MLAGGEAGRQAQHPRGARVREAQVRNASCRGAMLGVPWHEAAKATEWPAVACLLIYRVLDVFLKVAVTLFALVRVRVHGPVPAHALPQPVKVDRVAGVAVRVTVVLAPKAARQANPQAIPDGVEVTLPLPPTNTLKV